jgi:hypothetical protein
MAGASAEGDPARLGKVEPPVVVVAAVLVVGVIVFVDHGFLSGCDGVCWCVVCETMEGERRRRAWKKVAVCCCLAMGDSVKTERGKFACLDKDAGLCLYLCFVRLCCESVWQQQAYKMDAPHSISL